MWTPSPASVISFWGLGTLDRPGHILWPTLGQTMKPGHHIWQVGRKRGLWQQVWDGSRPQALKPHQGPAAA